uniref:Sec-independent protein translocase component TatC n=1 Tax=Chondria sp. (in: red algae) TaxID=1982705 RepID=A0A1Z1MRD5_9FLOR|nr:Sec-independent protein translocase component TatC [Chondria sp. (in: red algae)]
MKKIYYDKAINKEMPIINHLIELRERVITSLVILLFLTIVCLNYSKEITMVLQQPALGIKFLQLAPGEYLFVSIKVALYSSFLISMPFSFYQISLFILPGLTQQESRYTISILIGSIVLFFLGILFSYKILIPITLKFLINYGSDIVEPIWSFAEYFNFIILILFSTGISFQIPVIQVCLGITNVIKHEKMLESWKYIIFFATILGAIITPSTDPITQIIMTFTIVSLYLSGVLTLKILKK